MTEAPRCDKIIISQQRGGGSIEYFFHADTTKYRRRLKAIVITTVVPLFGICVFCAVNILLNFSSGVSGELQKLMAAVIAGCVFVGAVTIFTAAYFCYKADRRHSRFTYLDILPDGFVFSVYAGEFRDYSEKVILRRLYFVPFSGVEEISRDQKNSPFSITVRGEVRCYLCESDRLGYHVDEDDHMHFDSPELDEKGFEKLDVLRIDGWFGNTRKLERSLNFFLEQYRNAPEKKPFNIADYVAVKRKRRPTTSNPLLEAPSYDRNWK